MPKTSMDSTLPSAIIVNNKKLGTQSLQRVLDQFSIPIIKVSSSDISEYFKQQQIGYVAWIITSLQDFQAFSSQIMAYKHLPTKWMGLLTADVALPSDSDVSTYVSTLLQEISQLLSNTDTDQTDIRFVAYAGIGEQGTGESVLETIIRELQNNCVPKISQANILSINTNEFAKTICGLWFDRGHKRSRIVVKGSHEILIEPILKAIQRQNSALKECDRIITWPDMSAFLNWETVSLPGLTEIEVSSLLQQKIPTSLSKTALAHPASAILLDKSKSSLPFIEETIPELPPQFSFQTVVVEEPEAKPVKPVIQTSDDVTTSSSKPAISTPRTVEFPQEKKNIGSAKLMESTPANKVLTPSTDQIMARVKEIIQPAQTQIKDIHKTKQIKKSQKTTRHIGWWLGGWVIGLSLITLGVYSLVNPLMINPSESDISKLETQRYQILKQEQQLSSLPDFPLITPIKQSAETYIAKAEAKIIKQQADQTYGETIKHILTAGEGDPYELLQQAKLAYDDLFVYQTIHKLEIMPTGQLNQRRQFIAAIPYLIPSDKKSTILVLLQNNLELRPSGGFIGAVVLLTFDHGKMINSEVRDIYDLDSNLKGIVKPPTEITTYLGESNWFFRDSNWSPNFKDSAATASWFLDKERGTKADVVIGVNLNTIKNILNATGSITLPDGQVIDAGNLFISAFNHQDAPVVTPNAQKQEFLSLLVKPVMDRLTQSSASQTENILGALEIAAAHGDLTYSTLDNTAMNILDDLGWSGNLTLPTCPSTVSAPCFQDEIYVNEANVGINKTNYYLTRVRQHQITVNTDGLKETQTITYNNASASDQWPGGSYKSYIRIYIPSGATLTTLLVDNQSVPPSAYTQLSVPGFNQIGLYLEVKPQTNKTLSISYNVPYTGTGSIVWMQRKQPGQTADAVNLSISSGTKTIGKTISNLSPGDTSGLFKGNMDQNITAVIEPIQ